MPESKTHKAAKIRGGRGKVLTEVKIPGKRRLDAKIGRLAREVEKSGSPAKIAEAIKRLNTQKTLRKELLVSNEDLDKAKEIAQQVAKGRLTIQNLGRTKRRFNK